MVDAVEPECEHRIEAPLNMSRCALEPRERPRRLLEWDREEGQMPYTVARRGEGWVVCAEGQPVLIVKNRRVALHVAHRAAELLAKAIADKAIADKAASANVGQTERDPAAPGPAEEK
jgi:hypothetical protein